MQSNRVLEAVMALEALQEYPMMVFKPNFNLLRPTEPHASPCDAVDCSHPMHYLPDYLGMYRTLLTWISISANSSNSELKQLSEFLYFGACSHRMSCFHAMPIELLEKINSYLLDWTMERIMEVDNMNDTKHALNLRELVAYHIHLKNIAAIVNTNLAYESC